MKWKMLEEAEEELQRLESEHPDKFNVLKMELKSLISLFHDHDAGDTPSSASTATTQESRCRKRKRKRVGLRKQQTPLSALKNGDQQKPCCYKGSECQSSSNSISLDDRVEAVLHRAHLCLQKLHAFKTTLS